MLRVASYNIRKAVGLDWRRDPARILAVLDEVDADIVALQEADRRLGRRRAALTGLGERYHVAAVAVNDVSLGWHGNAILVRRGSGSIARSARLAIPGLEPRGAVLAEIGTAIGAVRVVGTHLALLRRWRLRQIAALEAHLASGRGAPAVVLGDFNEWGAEVAMTGFATTTPGLSFHAARPVAALDRVLTSPEITVAGSGVHRSPLAAVASDHLPVWVDIAFGPDRVGCAP